MSRMTLLGSFLGLSFALSVSGCNITTCEEGADCDGKDHDGDSDDNDDEHEQCVSYCGRLSVCGAPQARDFEACVEACEERFEVLPERTAELCACAEQSRCEDVIDGRCTEPGTGGQGGSGGSSYGGSTSQGGAPGNGGSSSGGSPSNGGSNSSGGSYTNGGSNSSGGSSSGTGGSDAGGAGGEDPGIACTCSCQCPSGQSCVSGYCTG
jgi:hypothetical protein